MQELQNALPSTPEQWIAAAVTIILAIIGLFRKGPPPTPPPPPEGPARFRRN